MHVFFPCEPSRSETLRTPDHELLACKLFTLKHAAHIYVIKSQPLRFDNRTKRYRDSFFISINRAALLKHDQTELYCTDCKHVLIFKEMY